MFEDHDLSQMAGELREVQGFGADPRPELIGILNRNTKIIRALASAVEEGTRTRGEQKEQVERMIAAAAEKFRAAQPQGVEWNPLGDDAVALRMYGTDDGGLSLLKSERGIKFPDGSEDVLVSHGFLTDPYPTTRAQAEIQRLYHGFAIAFRVVAKRAERNNQSVWKNPMVRGAWRRFSLALEKQPGELGRRIRSQLERAMSGGTGLGSEWVLSPQLDSLIRPYDLATSFMGRITQREAPGKTFDRPTISGEVLFVRAGNVTSNEPSAYRASDVTTGSVSTSIKDFAARIVVDKTWLSDMKDLVDPSELLEQVRRGAGRTMRRVVIHGDTAGTHQDTGIESWTIGGAAMGGSDSPLKQILGFRARAADQSNTNDAGQTFSAATAMAALERLGSRADSPNLAWLTSLHVLHTQIMPDTDFLTVDKIGDMATVRSGTMGMLLGKPLDVDEFITNDLDATTGLYDGSGDSTGILMVVDYGAYDLWMLQDLAEFEVVEDHKGAVHIGGTMRLTLDTNALSTDDTVSLDFDL